MELSVNPNHTRALVPSLSSCLTAEWESAFSIVSLWLSMLSAVSIIALKMAFLPFLPASFPCGPSIPNMVPF